MKNTIGSVLSKKRKNVVILLVLSFCFVFYSFFYQYHLYYLEQMQMFMLNRFHVLSYFEKPASLACLLGDFFTQFYYLKFGGAIVIVINLIILYLLLNTFVEKILKFKYAYLFSAIIVVVVALLHTSVYYSLSSTIAAILALSFLLLLSNISKYYFRYILGSLFIPVLYILVGSYVFLFIILQIFYEMFEKRDKGWMGKWVYILIIVAFSSITPYFFRYIYLMPAKQAYLFPNNEQISLVPDFYLEKLFTLDCEWYFNHPKITMEKAQEFNLKNRIASYYYNLSSSYFDLLPQKLMDCYQPGPFGLYLEVSQKQRSFAIAASNELYFFLGDMNTSQHSALLGLIFSPKSQSSRLMRRLIQINIVNGEYAVAEKYIKMLEATLFHSKWAHNQRKFLYNEDLCNNGSWVAEKRKQIPKFDLLKVDYNDFGEELKFLYENNKSKSVFDYLLCYYLLNKNINAFGELLIQDIENKGARFLPVLYQEALLIYYANNNDDSILKMVNFEQSKIKEFEDYTNIYVRYKGNGQALQEKYGKTYWFYYHYATFRKK